jgi:hypothetical protein
LWNQYIQYSVDRGYTLVHVLSHMNAVHINLTRFFEIHFNIILSSMPWYLKNFLEFNFSAFFSYEFLIQFQIPFKPLKLSFYLKTPTILVLKRWRYIVTLCIRICERGTSHCFQKKLPTTIYIKIHTYSILGTIFPSVAR